MLVDARTGVIEQSRRHTAIAALLRIPHLVVAVNKMDLVGWSEQRFLEIRAQFEEFLPRLEIKDVKFIPISALNGDNVVDPSPHTPWYSGPTLLGHLETRAHRERLESDTVSGFPSNGSTGRTIRPIRRCTTFAASAARLPAALCERARKSSRCRPALSRR